MDKTCIQSGAPSSQELISSLLSALNDMFFSILQVDLEKSTVMVLQSHDFPPSLSHLLDWDAYLARYAGVLTKEGYAQVLRHFSCDALREASRKGTTHFSFDFSYIRAHRTNWITISATLKRGRDAALIFVQPANQEHLLKSIIDLYVYSQCDFFLSLDARSDLYEFFNVSPNSAPFPSNREGTYSPDVAAFAAQFIAPEDQDLFLRETQLDRVLEQLDLHGEHSFYAGVADPTHGYRRKMYSYRYYDREARRILLTRTDVTQSYLRSLQRDLELQAAKRRAESDALTGLLNYGGMARRTEEILRKRESGAALLFLDLDDFKTVNDTLGHQAGDRLLRRVAAVLQEEVRKEDLVGRVGGDEFVIFLPRVQDKKEAARCARHICRAVAALSPLEGTVLHVTCSAGVAFAPEDGEDYVSLTDTADRRAYAAKAAGKNRYALE